MAPRPQTRPVPVSQLKMLFLPLSKPFAVVFVDVIPTLLVALIVVVVVVTSRPPTYAKVAKILKLKPCYLDNTV